MIPSLRKQPQSHVPKTLYRPLPHSLLHLTSPDMKMEHNHTHNAASLQPPISYCGVRKRKWGKWVSEIREPGKKTRIWLGSFDSPEAAATAHDVAALRLRGCNARLNFPETVSDLPQPASSDPEDIRSAALEAAARVRFRPGPGNVSSERLMKMSCGLGNDELGLESPKLWAELAEALLLAPPAVLYSGEVMGELEELQYQGSLWDAF